MEIIEKYDVEAWSEEVICAHCDTRVKIGVADLQHAKFKVSGYFFAGTAEVKTRFFVDCPACHDYIMVDDLDLHPLLKRAARDADAPQPG